MKKGLIVGLLAMLAMGSMFALEVGVGYSAYDGVYEIDNPAKIDASVGFDFLNGKLKETAALGFDWGSQEIKTLKVSKLIVDVTSTTSYELGSFIPAITISLGGGGVATKSDSLPYLATGDTVAGSFKFGIGGKLGYRVKISDTLSIVPSIGIFYDLLIHALTDDAIDAYIGNQLAHNYSGDVSLTYGLVSLPLGLSVETGKWTFGFVANVKLYGSEELEVKKQSSYDSSTDTADDKSFSYPVAVKASVIYKF